MRYVGQNFELPVLIEATLAAIRLPTSAALRQSFLELHERHYGYSNPDDLVEIVNFRLTATARLKYTDWPAPAGARSGRPEPVAVRPVYFAATVPESAQVFDRAMLAPSDEITGPAVIEQLDSTTIVFPGDRARIDDAFNLLIEVA
jgi:N-methylhydantoinase A